MKKIKKIIGIMSIVVGMFLLNSCSTIEGDDIQAYAVELLLNEYDVECVVGISCTPEDISSDNSGFWVKNLNPNSEMSYIVIFGDSIDSESGSITTSRVRNNETEWLLPISDKVCQIIPETITISLFQTEAKNASNIEISLVKNNN